MYAAPAEGGGGKLPGTGLESTTVLNTPCILKDAADCRRCAGPPHPFELAYEGAGRALELSGAGKEPAGAGNLGAFLPGFLRILETFYPNITKIDSENHKIQPRRLKKSSQRAPHEPKMSPKGPKSSSKEAKGRQKGSKRVLGASRRGPRGLLGSKKAILCAFLGPFWGSKLTPNGPRRI